MFYSPYDNLEGFLPDEDLCPKLVFALVNELKYDLLVFSLSLFFFGKYVLQDEKLAL